MLLITARCESSGANLGSGNNKLNENFCSFLLRIYLKFEIET